MNSKLKIIAALLVYIVLAWPVATRAEQVDARIQNTQPQSCPENECKPYDPRFKGVERVALYVHIPAKYEYAIECHDRIDECLKKWGSKDFPEKNDAKRQSWIDNYKIFPKALYPENLNALLKSQIDREIMPLVGFQEGCRKSEIIIDKAKADKLQKDPKVLIVDVRVRMFDDLKPPTAVLYLTAYRSLVSVRESFLHMEVIPLASSQEEIANQVKKFVEGVEVVTTCEMSQTGTFQPFH